MTTTRALRRQTLREAAQRWIAAHPVAMALFRRYALEALERGMPIGIGQLTERVRWEAWTDGKSGEPFKVNNNHRAYIARHLVREMPDLADLLVCRITRAADRAAKTAVRDEIVDPLQEEVDDGQ